MNEEQKQPSNKFMSGFIWGLLLGMSLTFLFATKRGRRMIKEVSDLALDLIDNFMNTQNIEQGDEFMDPDMESGVADESLETNNHSSSNGNGHTVSTRKRVFKQVKKKAS